MNDKNETLVIMNNMDGFQATFCIEVKNKDQVLKFDNIKYTQLKSCSEFIEIKKEALKSYMSASEDPKVLLNLE